MSDTVQGAGGISQEACYATGPGEVWATFERRLDELRVPAPHRPDDRRWVRFYLDFRHK